MNVGATLEAAEAAGREWPVIVVGAGPAGAFASFSLARAGVRTLLIDRQAFPRAKVCGGCLNARTLALLKAAGLGELPASLGGEPLDRFELWTGGRGVALSMPRGVAVSRAAFDEGLVREAIAAGADFLPQTRAVLGRLEADTRLVRLPQEGHRVRARSVIAADGLGGSFLTSESSHRSRATAESRVGAGAVLEDTEGRYPPGAIRMAVGKFGYVGVAKVEQGRLSVAAALDRDALGSGRTLDDAISELLAEAGLPPVSAVNAHWKGTAALSRSAPRVAFERVFLIGDAAGYVEPFTGEGMSWALEAGREVAPLVAGAAGKRSKALELQWRRQYRRRIQRRQHWCRFVSWGLRKQRLVASAASLLGALPALAKPLMNHLNAAPGENPS